MPRRWSILVDAPDFRRLFVGNSISLTGSSITTVALPLAAVVTLQASPAQMGILGAAALLPHLLFGLPAGVWVDRMRYRQILITTDVLQMLLIGAIPVLAAVDALRLWQLYVVALLTGVCALFDNIAAQSFTPGLVRREDLLHTNSAIAMSNSVVTTSGSALAGVLVQVLTAPVAIAIDAFSFAVSALCKARIRQPGPDRRRTPVRLRTEIAAGFGVLFSQPALRATTLTATIGALAGQMQTVVLILYFVRGLGLSSGWVGVVVAFAGVAGILGACCGPAVTGRIGTGPAFITGTLVAGLSGLVLAAASGSFATVLLVACCGQVLRGLGPSLYGINQQTLRQLLVPAPLLPRAQATWRFLVFGMQPIGALLGGGLASSAGLRQTLVISSLGILGSTAFALASPLRYLRDPGGAQLRPLAPRPRGPASQP